MRRPVEEDRRYGGGLNPEDGFPVFFTEVSRALNRYEDTGRSAAALAGRFPRAEFPRVLDVCCGVGRLSGALHRLGYAVTGIDLSARQIGIARDAEPGPAYLVGDMAAPPPGPFDLLANVYTSFGYFSTEEEDLSVLPAWRRSLRPGGCLVMELADMDRARRRIPADGRLTRVHGEVTEHLTMDWDARLLTVDYLYRQETWRCVTRLYEKDALARGLAGAGFVDVELCGDFDGRAKDPDDNLVIFARNP
jgi:SAM-dependent methyltransferase